MSLSPRSTPIRILVVEDSPTARDLLVRLLEGAGDMQVVGAAANGEQAVRLARSLQPDVITMDIVMPHLDGVAATRQIMHTAPTRIVIVTAEAQEQVNQAFAALGAGALTVVAKPGLADPQTSARLLQSVRLMAHVPVVRRWDPSNGRAAKDGAESSAAAQASALPDGATTLGSPAGSPALAGLPAQAGPAAPAGPELIDPAAARRVRVAAIASSTGGPSALAAVLAGLPPAGSVPVLVVQHITAGFAPGLAAWLSTQTGLQVRTAENGDSLQPGRVLLAPDSYHMWVSPAGLVELRRGEPYKGLLPSANLLFQSLAAGLGSSAAGIVLTGMGDDGAEGLLALRQAGGLTIAQDEKSCVVYGMPREAVARRAAAYVLNLEGIAQALRQLGQKNGIGGVYE